jgi:hypothetical protein
MSGQLLATIVLGLLAVGFAGAEFMKPPRWLRWALGVLSASCFVAAIVLLVSFAPFQLQMPIKVLLQSPIIFPVFPDKSALEAPDMRIEGNILRLWFGDIGSSGPIAAAEGETPLADCFGTDPWIAPSGHRMKRLGCFTESCGVHVFVEHEHLFINAIVYGGAYRRVIVNHNRVEPDSLMMLPNWDYNSNKRALEIVDSGGFPVFQMIFEPPNSAKVLGIYPFPNDEVLIQDNFKKPLAGLSSMFYDAKAATSTNKPKGTETWRLFHLNAAPLFKYPSWRYPGELR